MIELYLSLSEKLKELPELKLIDIEGSNDTKLYPAAFISLGDLPYEQLQGGATIATFPFTVKVEINPIHRSESKSPVLDALKDNMTIINEVKKKLINEAVDYISGVMLVGEGLTKAKGKYVATFRFVGSVEYTPE